MKAKSPLLIIALTIIAIIGANLAVNWLKSPAESAGTETSNANAIVRAPLKPSDDIQQIAIGAALYGTHCASCHGANLEGQPDWQTPHPNGVLKAPPHDDSGHTWHHDDQTLIKYTKLGGRALMAESGVNDFASGMPGFADTLTDLQINQVLAFIKSRWSKRSRKVQRERNRSAETN